MPCKNCNSPLSFRKPPFRLKCCSKMLCNNCGNNLAQSEEEEKPCSFCEQKLSLETDLHFFKNLVISKLIEIETEIQSDHRQNFKIYNQNMSKIQAFYTKKMSSKDREIAYNSIRLLRKDEEKKIHSYVTEVDEYKKRFVAFRIAMQKDDVFFEDNSSLIISFIDTYNLFLKKLGIFELTEDEISQFCTQDLKDVLKQKNLNSLKFLLEYKEFLNEHFTRVYSQLLYYLDFLKKLEKLFLTLVQNDEETNTSLSLKYKSEYLKIKLLFKNKLVYTREQRNQLVDMFVHINKCIDKFYSSIREGHTNFAEDDYDFLIDRIKGFLRYEFNDVYVNSIYKIDMSSFNFFTSKTSFENFKQIYSYPNSTKKLAAEIIDEYKYHRIKIGTLGNIRSYGKIMNFFFIIIDMVKVINYFIMLGISLINLNLCQYNGFLLPLIMILLSISGIFFTSARFGILGYLFFKKRRYGKTKHLSIFDQNVMMLFGNLVLFTPVAAANYLILSIDRDGTFIDRKNEKFCYEGFYLYCKYNIYLGEYATNLLIAILILIFMIWNRFVKTSIRSYLKKVRKPPQENFLGRFVALRENFGRNSADSNQCVTPNDENNFEMVELASHDNALTTFGKNKENYGYGFNFSK